MAPFEDKNVNSPAVLLPVSSIASAAIVYVPVARVTLVLIDPVYVPSFAVPLALLVLVKIKDSLFFHKPKLALETETSSVALNDPVIVPPGSIVELNEPEPETITGRWVSVSAKLIPAWLAIINSAQKALMRLK